MRSLQELIDTQDPGWDIVKQWIKQSNRLVEILPQTDKSAAEQSLLITQVTTRSPLGAILYETGGLSIDHGWIRVLGGGSYLPSLYQWNLSKTIEDDINTKGYLIVALDALGGYFCINGGKLGADIGMIYYFAPDTLDFEALEITYSELIHFFLVGDTAQFYATFRWNNWLQDTQQLDLNRVFDFFPPLWTQEGKNINETMRQTVSAEQQFEIMHEFRTGLNQITIKYKP